MTVTIDRSFLYRIQTRIPLYCWECRMDIPEGTYLNSDTWDGPGRIQCPHCKRWAVTGRVGEAKGSK